MLFLNANAHIPTEMRPLRKQSNTRTSIWSAKIDIMPLRLVISIGIKFRVSCFYPRESIVTCTLQYGQQRTLWSLRYSEMSLGNQTFTF